MIARANVHAGLSVVPYSAFEIERDQTICHDRGRDHPVTTQVTTQIFRLASLPKALDCPGGYPAHPRLVNVRVAFRKKFEKVRECPLLSSMESHNRRMELPQCCCVATVVLKVLERHSQDFHG